MRLKKVITYIERHIKHHNINDHNFKRRVKYNNERIPTNVPLNEVVLLILEHLNLEIVDAVVISKDAKLKEKSEQKKEEVFMSGHHNLKIYTLDDNPFCLTCKNGELFKSTWVFREGGYICWHPKGMPSNEECEGYKPASKELVKMFKSFK